MQLYGYDRSRTRQALDWLQFGYQSEIQQAKNFIGDVTALDNTTEPAHSLRSLMIHENTLYWVSPKFEPDWFGSRYASPEDIKAELKKGFARDWPENFPWETHLVEIYGICSC